MNTSSLSTILGSALLGIGLLVELLVLGIELNF